MIIILESPTPHPTNYIITLQLSNKNKTPHKLKRNKNENTFEALWAVVNLNSNRTCLYRPARYVRRVPACQIRGTVRRPNQANIRQGSIFLAQSRRRANYDNSHGAFRLLTVPGLILGLFDQPHRLSPPCRVNLNSNRTNLLYWPQRRRASTT